MKNPKVKAWLSLQEKFLVENLSGYSGYSAKVRWRLMPGVFQSVLPLGGVRVPL
jgi:hypothetical protein